MEPVYDKNGKKVIGSATGFLKAIQRDIIAGEAKVPCGTCVACCSEPNMPVDLAPDEYDKFPEAVQDTFDPSKKMLPKTPDGVCVHLINNKCSIYDKRPRCCRTFDCRACFISGIQKELSVLVKSLDQWAPLENKTPEDGDVINAISALHFMSESSNIANVEGYLEAGFPTLQKLILIQRRIRHQFALLSPEEKANLKKETRTWYIGNLINELKNGKITREKFDESIKVLHNSKSNLDNINA